MKIKYIELHYNGIFINKHKLDHIEGNTRFYFTSYNKKYYYDCTTRNVFKKSLFFWIRQRNLKVEYAVFLEEEDN